MLYLACTGSANDLQEVLHPKHLSESTGHKDREQLKEQSSNRQRLFAALDARFHTETVAWRTCGGDTTSADFSGPVSVQLTPPSAHQDVLEDVLGYCDKTLRANDVEKVTTSTSKTGIDSKYHVVPSPSIPDSLELLAPLTVDYIRHKEQFGDDDATALPGKTPPKAAPHPLAPVDRIVANCLLAVQRPLMLNLLAAFERNKLKYASDAEMVFDEAIVRLAIPYDIDQQIKTLDEMGAREEIAECVSAKCKNLSKYLQALIDDEMPSKRQAAHYAEMLVKTMPDDPYRQKALYYLAQRSASETLPGLNNTDSEKNFWHSVTVVTLMTILLTTSPVFAFILIHWFFKRRPKQTFSTGTVQGQAALSEVPYGWNRIWSVVVFLIVSIALVFAFEWSIGAVSELENIIMAVRNPILSGVYEMVESTLFNSTVLFVYFAYCIPKGIGFREAFALRLRTDNYSFKKMAVLGVVAYLALNLVTSATMILMVVYHHPETPADQSASVARALSLGASGIYFFTESILGPLMEELCFRGVLYRGLRYSWGVFPSLIVSSLWFAVLHGQLAPWLLFHKFAVGAVNALLYERTKSLTPAIIAHALNNIFLDLF